MFQKLLLVPLAALSSLALLYTLVLQAPNEGGQLGFPSSLEDIRTLSTVLNTYSSSHPQYVLLLFSSAYLFKQTFAVPGSVFLNVLAGAIFGTVGGFLLCCSLTALGASLCYTLARAVGKEVAMRHFPDRVERFREKLEENRQELPFFLLFLRLFPMSPNWALNMASGVLGRLAGLIYYFNRDCRGPSALILPVCILWSDALQLPLRDQWGPPGRDQRGTVPVTISGLIYNVIFSLSPRLEIFSAGATWPGAPP